jgi:hypothetical protein
MTAGKDETQLTEDDIYEEHQRSVKPTAHWAYLFGVLGGGLLFMVALIAVLGGSA